MFRRLLTILLIVGYATSQLAALPHAHASQPAGHGARPHVHSDWLSRLVSADTYSHPHHHHDDAHHHGHGHSHSHGKPQPAPTPAVPAEQGHDDDCVYLPDSVTSIKEGRPADWFLQIAEAVAPVPAPCASADAVVCHWGHCRVPPDRLAGGCALYLTLRTLRI